MENRRRVLEAFYKDKAALDQHIEEGIETHRKGDAVLVVKDENGSILPGARIRISQKSHAFRFGANLFMLDELETAEKNEQYKQYFIDTFNMATLPFYWDATEPRRGETRYTEDSPRMYRRPPIDRCIAFCEKHGIEPREHALAYENFFPKWLYDASVDEIKAALENRYREISERYADKIPTIEVTNEMDWEKGKTAFYEAPEYVEWCFKLAEKYFKSNRLVINESTSHAWKDRCRTTDKYYAYIEANMLKGARIDAIGMQYHMFHKKEAEYEKTRITYDPDQLYRHMDLYANLGKPLQVTEVTVPAYSNDPDDEAIQAEILEFLYSIWFSHPKVEQIIYWNLVDGYAHVWDPDPEVIRASQGNMTLGENYYYGGLLHFDMTPKPAFYTIQDLIKKKWHTEASGSTDERGCFRFRGFYGDYDVEIETENGTRRTTVTLSAKESGTIEVTT